MNSIFIPPPVPLTALTALVSEVLPYERGKNARRKFSSPPAPFIWESPGAPVRLQENTRPGVLFFRARLASARLSDSIVGTY